MRKEAVKTRAKRQATSTAWFKLNPPDEFGRWECYLQISDRCPRWVTIETLNIEHVLSKARRPDLKHDLNNLRPACGYCNELKQSLSAEEAKEKYGWN